MESQYEYTSHSRNTSASIISLSVLTGAIGLTVADILPGGIDAGAGFLIGFLAGFITLSGFLLFTMAFNKDVSPQDRYDEDSCPVCGYNREHGTSSSRKTRVRGEGEWR